MDLSSSTSTLVQVTKYRWIILILFCLYAAISFIQFLQYTIIGSIIAEYYNVEDTLVDLTGLIFMISTIVLVAPANYLIGKYDLKIISIIVCSCTTLGNLLKLASVAPDRFYVVMISQFICSLGQVFILNVPSKLASTWFGPTEVSTASAIAVLGTQSGIAIGLLFPSQFVYKFENNEQVENGLWTLHAINNSVTILIFILVIIFFKARPALPPSQSQVNLTELDQPAVLTVLKKLITNRNYLLLLLIFGLTNGIYSFFGIVVNKVYLHYFPGSEKLVGVIACLTAFFGGCIGSVVFGTILDRWHKFRLTSFIMIFSAALSFIIVAVVSELKSQLATYFIFPLFGFFIASCLVVSFEFATEIAYPLPDEASLSLLNAVIYSFGIIFTLTFGNWMDTWGYIPVDICVVVLLLFAAAMLYFVEPKLNRREANMAKGNDGVN